MKKKTSKLLSLLKSINLNSKIKRKRSFNRIILLNMTPNPDQVTNNNFVVVRHNNINYWAMFRCPCQCGSLISLSLQTDWSVDLSRKFPTLYPSVWQTNGCFSHFWIRNGKILWCEDTGIEPWKAKPSIYSTPKSKI